MPISIIIPTKDRPSGLQRAVTSARAELPYAGEIVVVDDGCATPVMDVLQPSEGGGEDVRVVRNEGPIFGPSAARNFGVGLAKHPVILFLDDDDELLPGYPSRVVTAARERPDVIYGSCAKIRRRPGRKDKITPRDRRLGRRDTSWSLPSRLCGAGGLWIRRDDFLALGGFDEELPIIEDHELCIRLAKANAAMWFDDRIGYLISARASGRDTERVSRRTDAETRLGCCDRILLRHGEFLAQQAPRVHRRYVTTAWKCRLKSRLRAIFGESTVSTR